MILVSKRQQSIFCKLAAVRNHSLRSGSAALFVFLLLLLLFWTVLSVLWISRLCWFYMLWYWSLLYSTILRSWAYSLRSHVILHEWIAFYNAFLNIHRSGVLTALAWLVPQESAARESQSRHILCTPYNHAPCHFMQSHIHKVYACLSVTCHLRFWQNDQGLLRATAVTRGWNRYQNKSQHRKLTLEKKILPPLQQGFEPVTFRSRVRRSNHWAIPAPAIPAPTVMGRYIDNFCLQSHFLLLKLERW